MAGKQKKLPNNEQSARFEAEVQRMIDAGELNPTEADKAFDALLEKGIREQPKPNR